MLPPDHPELLHARLQGQRASAEQLVDALKKNLAAWLEEERGRGTVRRAFLADHNDEWRKRVEGVVRQLEQHVAGIRTHEDAFAAQLAAAATAPAPEPKPARRRRAKPKARRR